MIKRKQHHAEQDLDGGGGQIEQELGKAFLQVGNVKKRFTSSGR
jgi:hypothetical protein